MNQIRERLISSLLSQVPYFLWRAYYFSLLKFGFGSIRFLLTQVPPSAASSRNTLILLTDLPEDLPTLINLLSSGDLSSCVTQGDIGVSGIG